MLLAEALSRRADLNKLIGAEREQLQQVARYQDGEEPAEQAKDILDRVERNLNTLCDLISAINHTNSVTVLPSGGTITQAIAERDRLASLGKLLRETAESASGAGHGRYAFLRQTRTELVMKTDLDVPNLKARAATTSARHREIDNELQKAGWVTELIGLAT